MEDILRRTSERSRRLHGEPVSAAPAAGLEAADRTPGARNPGAQIPWNLHGHTASDEARSRGSGQDSPSSLHSRQGSRLGLIEFIGLLRSNGIGEDKAPDEDVELVFSKHASMGTGGKLNFLAVQSAVREVLEAAASPSSSQCPSRHSSKHASGHAAPAPTGVLRADHRLGAGGGGMQHAVHSHSPSHSSLGSEASRGSASLTPTDSRSGKEASLRSQIRSASSDTQSQSDLSGTSSSKSSATSPSYVQAARARYGEAVVAGAASRACAMAEGLQSSQFISRPHSFESDAASEALAATEAVYLSQAQVCSHSAFPILRSLQRADAGIEHH